jgi:hypothetical protein
VQFVPFADDGQGVLLFEEFQDDFDRAAGAV